jgi:glycosyltransferase involved in cell wall biosynthesis
VSTQEASDNMRVTDFEPILLLEVDLADPLEKVSFYSPETDVQYSRAIMLVRIHTYPIGYVTITAPPTEISAIDCAQIIWRELNTEIVSYTQTYGLPAIDKLGVAGLSELEPPEYIKARHRLLETGPFISIVVATRNRPDSLVETLRSLSELAYTNYEIIVVDNAPTTQPADQVVTALSEEIPNMRYLREDRIGLSWARNCGLRAALGEITVFSDDDVQVDQDWLTALVEGFNAGDNVACVTGLIRPHELETPAQVWCEEHGGFGKGYMLRVFDLDENRADDPLFPYRLSMLGTGANTAFKSEVLRSFGGMDPALGAGSPARSGEEFSAFYHILKNGYQIVYQPGALIYHSHYRDYASFKKQFYGYGVGYGAFLTKCILDDPKTLLALLSRLPYVLFFVFNSDSPKHEMKTADYPKELDRFELFGLLYGPIAYLQSRYRTYRLQKQRKRLSE